MGPVDFRAPNRRGHGAAPSARISCLPSHCQLNSAGTNSKFSIASVIEVPAIAVFTATTPTTTA